MELANREAAQRVEIEARTVRQGKIKTEMSRGRAYDGSTSSAVCEWIADIEMVVPYMLDDKALNEAVANTCQGSLIKAYEKFMNAQADRNAVIW